LPHDSDLHKVWARVEEVEHAPDYAWTPLQKNMAAMAGAQLSLQHSRQLDIMHRQQKTFDTSLQQWNPWPMQRQPNAGTTMLTLSSRPTKSSTPPSSSPPDEAQGVANRHVTECTKIAGDSMTPTSTDNAEVLWLVRTGPPHNLRWRECEPELAAKLETAYQKGMTVFTNEWDGWVYQYNLQNMTQTSLCAPHTERAVRRVLCSSPA